jgi:Fe-S-cluster containining protein
MSIAYKGKVGKRREEFCLKYIVHKKELLRQIRLALALSESKTGKHVTCKKGCSYCCSMHIEASLQECEAIVYYLYNNPMVLISFLKAYPVWREQLKRNGDIFKGRGSFWNARVTRENAVNLLREFNEEEQKYFAQDIPCPFLSSHLCLIYEVRPYVCATHAAVTPPEWCKPDSKEERKNINPTPVEILEDRSFYHGDKLKQKILSTMPLAVYEILKSGLSYLSMGGIPEMKDFDRLWLTDPEVMSILRKYGWGNFGKSSRQDNLPMG